MKKTDTVTLDGEDVKIKKGALHRQLKVKGDYKFKITELRKINKNEVGKEFEFQGKMFKMTPLLKKRVTLAITLMR
jgi:hypothetical protein